MLNTNSIHRLLASVRNLSALALVAIVVVSCGTAKSVVNSASNSNSLSFSNAKFVEMVEANISSQQALTAKLKLVATASGQSASTGGTLKMKKDEIIQLSLVDPLLGAIEVGRMEFTPTNVMIIDRINKQYVDVPYSDISFLSKANIDFNTLQSLFWNEVFVPGKSSISASDFDIKNEDGGIVNLNYQDKLLLYKFITALQNGQLTRTNITNPKDSAYAFDFTYGDFSIFEGKQFPKNLKMAFTAGSQSASLSMSLSSIRNTTDVGKSSAPSKYTKADPEKIFKMLVK